MGALIRGDLVHRILKNPAPGEGVSSPEDLPSMFSSWFAAFPSKNHSPSQEGIMDLPRRCSWEPGAHPLPFLTVVLRGVPQAWHWHQKAGNELRVLRSNYLLNQ